MIRSLLQWVFRSIWLRTTIKFMSQILEKQLLTQEEMDAVQQAATDAVIAAVNESVKAKAADPAGLEAAVFKAVM